MKSKNLIAFIFARGGSKGIKDKNIRHIGGKPLIQHSIDCGLASKFISKVIVSTDSDKIANVAQSCGAEVLMRPDELAADASPEILSWKHAIQNTNSFIDQTQSIFISLPATSPLRLNVDVDAAIEKYLGNKCDILFGICPSDRNPYLNMVTIDKNDLIQIAIGGSNAVRRQDVPKVFNITTCVYVSSAKYILETDKLMAGRVGYIEIPVQRSLDIDEEYDLYLADLLLKYPFKKVN